MSRSTRKACLPLRVSAVPTTVLQWLRNAGIPAAPLQQVHLGEKHELAGATVLFDSRSAASRADVESINGTQTSLIDIAPLLVTEQADQPTIIDNNTIGQHAPVARMPENFLVRLKNEVELRGGLWVRLADYPFPFQSVLCIGEWPNWDLDKTTQQLFSQLPTQADSPSEIEICQQKYAAGLPFHMTVPDWKTQSVASAPLYEAFPLLWKTTFPEFIRWRKLRLQATFHVVRENGLYRFNSEANFEHFCPMLELWRGTYLASFRLLSNQQKVREEGLAYQQAYSRHPGGFSAHRLQGRSLPDVPELMTSQNSVI